MDCQEDEMCEAANSDHDEDFVHDLQRVFPQPGRLRHRIRSQSFSISHEGIEESTEEPPVIYQRRPRSNSEPLKGVKSKKHEHRAEVRFPTPFSRTELEELSKIIAGDTDKMQGIDLDFIGLPANACKATKLGDLVEVAEDVEEMKDLRLNHFEKALEEGRLRLKSDKIWRYKKHRKSVNREPVDEWLRNSCNNNHGLIPNAY